VATFKLKEPLVFGDRRIPCLELPAPKAGSPYPAGATPLQGWRLSLHLSRWNH
jgi:predicted metalloenzyme YecM